MPEDLSLPPDVEILSQPLMTEEGFVNPACMNELSAALDDMGKNKTHSRLSNDPEWSTPRWTFRVEIVGSFAKYACQLSPYGVPDGLENVCKYLYAALKTAAPWNFDGMAELSLCQINKALYDILYEQGVEEFNAWNRCKKGDTPNIQFTSRYDGPGDPDRNFIDLDALLHNVCLDLRMERRAFDAFDKAFKAGQSDLEKAEAPE